jgi:hypothetical protein
MTVEGNVIRCDECGLQVSMAMRGIPTPPKVSLPDRVRAFAQKEGWSCSKGSDVCPGHEPNT